MTFVEHFSLYCTSTQWTQTRVKSGWAVVARNRVASLASQRPLHLSADGLCLSISDLKLPPMPELVLVLQFTMTVSNVTTKRRMKLDLRVSDSFLTVMQRFGLFIYNLPHTLQNIASKDLASQEIEDNLLTAAQKEQDCPNVFVERLLPTEARRVTLGDKLQQISFSA